MIRALQKKFVITSMTAISVLLLVLLGGINITNIVLSEKETLRYPETRCSRNPPAGSQSSYDA